MTGDDFITRLQLQLREAAEREGGEKPVCVAETLVRAYG